MFKKCSQKTESIINILDDDLIRLFIKRTSALCKRKINRTEASDIVDGLISYRLILFQLIESPVQVFNHLFTGQISKKIVFPCDIVSLRSILHNRQISHNYKNIPLFSLQFAERYLTGYPVHLLLDKDRLDGKIFDLCGLNIYDSPLIIDNALIRINVNAHGNEYINVVKSIMDEEFKGVEIGIVTGVPSLKSNYASTCFNMKKFSENEDNINLNPHEKEIFDFLRIVTPTINPNIELRIVGG